MAPWSTRSSEEVWWRQSYWLWRAMTVCATIVAAGALALAPYLFTTLNDTVDSNERAIASNHNLTCALGDLVTIGGGSLKQAVLGPRPHVIAELEFLTTIIQANCRLIEAQPKVKAEIVRTIAYIKEFLNNPPEAGGGR